ncbi:uncharacterized protein CBL_11314 [Carabus blaptoides fortunei]
MEYCKLEDEGYRQSHLSDFVSALQGFVQYSATTQHLTTCRQMEFGVQAIFGPSDPLLGAHIQSICEALDVPHLEARIDFEPVSKEFSINLHPSQDHMNRAFKDLMSFLNWTKVAILYEEDYGLFKLQELVKTPPAGRTEMYIRQASPSSYRQVLKEVRQKEIYKLIVDTNPRHMSQFFRAKYADQLLAEQGFITIFKWSLLTTIATTPFSIAATPSSASELKCLLTEY